MPSATAYNPRASLTSKLSSFFSLRLPTSEWPKDLIRIRILTGLTQEIH
jgi:hypothetical protein